MGANDKPPTEMENRKVEVQADVVNTVEVPCDPRDPDFARWFDTTTVPFGGQPMQPLRKANHVTALVDGNEAFVEMFHALDTAEFIGDFIYMLNWWAELNLALAPASKPTGGAASTQLGDLLSNAVAHGVQVRAMLWDQPGSQNSPEVKQINTLNNTAQADANGGAILDDNTVNDGLDFGTHHQKILIVRGKEGLIAFCGGADFNTDRVSHIKRQGGSPMHDVHCRIVGPAAFDLLQVFIQRWTDHPDSVAIDKAKGVLRGLTEPVPKAKGEQYVQIGRTYPNGKHHKGIKNATGGRFYTFAPDGERTAERVIFNAIEQAQQYIYVEDQYLVSMEASNKLLAQLPKIQKLIILIPHPTLNDHPNIWSMVKRFVDNLKGDPKLVVCYLKEAGATPDPKVVAPTTVATYVHAKIWIMDDKFAVIGSANCNRRGYTHDSEVVAGIYDESKDTPCTIHFAHDLRIRLWADHLKLPRADVFDPIGAAAHWFKPSIASKIAVFDQNAAKDSSTNPSNFPSEAQSEPFGG
jgi:phosphatidylserine/phosphatidylglycerophosphate/cardiolipin synthase-like enzyme